MLNFLVLLLINMLSCNLFFKIWYVFSFVSCLLFFCEILDISKIFIMYLIYRIFFGINKDEIESLVNL